jgi:hypothetical protein
MCWKVRKGEVLLQQSPAGRLARSVMRMEQGQCLDPSVLVAVMSTRRANLAVNSAWLASSQSADLNHRSVAEFLLMV